MKKLSNDENIANLKKRKIFWYIIIVMYVLAIVIAFASLFIKNWFVILSSLIFFLLAVQLKKMRDGIVINKIDDYVDEREDIKAIAKEREKIRKRNKKGQQ
jgi:hypothetical protein